jgi:hypothetical protein
MKILLKPKQDEVYFPASLFDVDLTYTIDHIISLLTLKFKAIDATELVIYLNGKKLPFELEVLKAGINEMDQLEVGILRREFCNIV